MNYDIIAVPQFRKELKRLAKKHTSLKTDFSNFLEELKNDPTQGISLGKNCYKTRMSISSKNKGKSGGARVITNVLVQKNKIYLLSIYDKSEKGTLSNAELKELLESM